MIAEIIKNYRITVVNPGEYDIQVHFVMQLTPKLKLKFERIHEKSNVLYKKEYQGNIIL